MLLLRRFLLLGLFALSTIIQAAPGDLDSSFSSGTGTDGIVTAVLPLPSGQTLVAGLFTTYNGVARRGLARVNANGSLDTSFAPTIEAPASGGVVTLLRDNTGRIYIGGIFTKVGSAERRGLARLNADGALDTAFSPALPLGAAVAALALSTDGTALFVGGILSPASNLPLDNGQAIAKLRVSDGLAIPEFTAPGMSAYDSYPAVYKILPLADGRIVVAGEFSGVKGGNDHWNICRLRVDGSIDPSFTLGTPIVWTQISDIDVDATGRIYLSGNFIQIGSFTAGCIARLTAGGAIDTSFKFPAQVAGQYDRAIVNNLLITSDGWLIAVGDFIKYNGTEAKYIARVFEDGTLDTTFRPAVDNEVVAIEEDASGRLLIGGSFQTVNNSPAHNLARLTRNGDGPIYRSAPAAGTVVAGQNLVLTPALVGATAYQWYRDGIAVPGATSPTLALASADIDETGSYTLVASNRFGSTTSSAIAVRVLPAGPGTADPAFDLAREPFNADHAMTRNADDTWVAVLNGSKPQIVRYDASFNRTAVLDITGFSSFSAATVATNATGRLWLVGQFTLSSGLTRKIVRLTASGAFDPTFDNTTYDPAKIHVLSDSTALLLREQTLVKLRSSGAEDESFPSRRATCFAMQSDGRIVCGSNPGASSLELLRLNADGTIDPSFTAPAITGLGRRGWQWPIYEVRDVAITSTGDIVATSTPLFAFAQFVRLGPSGELKSHYELSNVEGAYARLAGTDSNDGVFVLTLGSLSYIASSGTSFPLRDQVQSSLGCWISPAQGVLLRCGTGTGFSANGSTYLRVLDRAPGAFHLVNLSGRGIVGVDENALIVGFVTEGRSAPTLVRGIGPSLKPLGVNDAQTDLALDLYQGSTVLHTNDNWPTSLDTLFTKTGALSLPEGSRDAAIAPTLNGGVYSAMLRPVSSPGGVGLAEVYDASDHALRLVNVSIRGRVEPGEKNLFGGFVITGESPRWVLIRAIGPSLRPLGVNQPLADPTIKLMRGSTAIAEDDDWSAGGNGPLYAAAARKVGAFSIPTGSKDSVIYAYLSPGIYSAIVGPKDDSDGIALLEIYSLEN